MPGIQEQGHKQRLEAKRMGDQFCRNDLCQCLFLLKQTLRHVRREQSDVKHKHFCRAVLVWIGLPKTLDM